MSTTFYLKADDQQEIFIRYWEISEPKAIIQLVHGMNEHSERYHEFAHFLNQEGYSVVATDHRGHGKSAKKIEEIGYIGENGFRKMVSDERMLYQYMNKGGIPQPYFMIGHSMGSFITQRYMQLYSKDLQGAILVGSGSTRWDMKLGATVSTVFERFTGDHRSKSLDKLIFNGYNSRFEKRTDYEWLANDSRVIEAYLNDPYCAHIFPPSFFRQFLTFLPDLFKSEHVSQVIDSLPVYILSGENDPVGQYGKGVEKLYKRYKENGLKDVQYKLYSNGRHEILNDYNRMDVYGDILTWLEKHHG